MHKLSPEDGVIKHAKRRGKLEMPTRKYQTSWVKTAPKLEKSIGFVLFESKPESDSIKLSIRDRLVDGKVIQGRFIGK